MAIKLEQIGSELGLIRHENMECDWNINLHYCRMEYAEGESEYQPTEDDNLLHDVFRKGLLRGKRPFSSYFTEEKILSLYGKPFNLAHTSANQGTIDYSYDQSLIETYKDFSDLVDPWIGSAEDVAFDSDNERELFKHLLEHFGERLAHYLEPQANIASILPAGTADSFSAQRADILLSFPNGRSLLLEPGDHDDNSQIGLDQRRDRAFENINIETIRPRNNEIRNTLLYDEIRNKISQLDAEPYLAVPDTSSEKLLVANYLFLLPSLIARVEQLLLYFFFRKGLAHQKELHIGIIERDLGCAEIALASFIEKIQRLSSLYGIKNEMPSIRLYVQRNPAYRYGEIENLDVDVSAEQCDDFSNLSLDLILDVGIKCNALTKANQGAATYFGSARQCFPHNQPVSFGYRSSAKAISITDTTDELLSTFVRDYFRKKELRPGQSPILRNVLSQKSTIGLLPTGAGKSLCYQLASLLTPGTTIIVSPLVALMEDQAQYLKDIGIDRIVAWHGGSNHHDKNIGTILIGSSMVFIAPERLQRPKFREAIQSLNASDIYINYAVIDEAHCVSMWGHDFRPSYLALERSFRKFCTFQGRKPVLVALTGTASNHVLIDLKRELDIRDSEAIVRPKTFKRPELHFNLVKCPNSKKANSLQQVTDTIARRLNIQQLDMDAHGMIFAYTPKEAWQLFGKQVGDAKGVVRTVLTGSNSQLRCGIYTGKPPSDEKKRPLFHQNEWTKYKKDTLKAFKRGQIRMLFGNTAVGVGIDNEHLNYVINYRMPQSMEAYYQQCGRAGRNGQDSECFLIFSDDTPRDTQRWLNHDIEKMPYRGDDLGTVAYFHQNNFPGIDQDYNGSMLLSKNLYTDDPDQQGMVEVKQFFQKGMTKAEVARVERTERYISYWLILGVIDDYEVTGMKQNTVYRIHRHPIVETYQQNRAQEPLKEHIINSLYSYLSRYQPTLKSDIEKEVNECEEPKFISRALRVLIKFLYERMEYQHRESIRTMVNFCNEADTSPKRLQDRITAYFDSSDKFSNSLSVMSESSLDMYSVVQLLDRIDGLDDAEHLHWETRRLLDERPHVSWEAISLYAHVYAYSEEVTRFNTFVQSFERLIERIREEKHISQEGQLTFLIKYMSYFTKLDRLFSNVISTELFAIMFDYLYKKYGMEYLGMIDKMEITEEQKEYIHTYIATVQLGGLINARHSRIA